jgi:hypothetical protein
MYTYLYKSIGILTATSRIPGSGSCELVMLPYNYPIILPLIQRAFEFIKIGKDASLQIAAIFQQGKIIIFVLRHYLSVTYYYPYI